MNDMAMQERRIARHNARVEARYKMSGKRRVKIRPLKAHVLRVWLNEDLSYVGSAYKSFNFTYLQQGKQWRNDVYATDELDAWRKAKAELKAGNCYLGRRYYEVK